MSTHYKHKIKERKQLAIKSVVVSEMNTFLTPSKKNNTGSTYEQIADKWLNLLPIRVLSKSHFTDGIEEYELKIPVDEIRKMFQYTYTENGKRKKWFDWFQNKYPLWMTTKRGYQGQYTVGTPTFNLIDQLTKIPAERFVEAWELEHKADSTPDMQTELIEIDAVNLGHYIEYCKSLNNNSKKFQRATARAIMVYKLALGINATVTCGLTGKVTYQIPQTYTTAYSGRRYYTGSSALQSCSKAVRGAALGPCYEVDLSSSVYSYYKWLGSEFGIDTNILTELLENKSGFRQHLANNLTDTRASNEFKLGLIKDVMQAIGFGSNPANSYSTVSKVIYNKEDYKRLTTDPKFVALRQVYKDILAKVKADPEYVALQKEYKANTGKTKTKWVEFMAYLYQSYESIAMSDIIDSLKDRGVLLWVHDGVYTKRKPNLMDIQYIVNKLNPYATVDLEVHEKYTASSGTKNKVLSEEAQHRARIAEQEQIAKATYTKEPQYYSEDPELALEQVLKEQGYTL